MIFVLLAACKTRGITYVAGPDAGISIVIVDPTTCSDCDPLEDVDGLRVDVVRPETGEVLATDSFPWPGDAPEVPSLTDFGVVRVELYGLQGSNVVSAGRTAPFAVDPGNPATIPMLFLPANRMVPLTGNLWEERSRHVSFRRPDGRIALIGGVDRFGEDRFDSSELFDPATHTFGPDAIAPNLPAFPAWVREVDGDLLMVGGEDPGENRESLGWVYEVSADGAQGVLAPQGAMEVPRSKPCVGLAGERIGVVMGGVDDVEGDAVVDVMRLGDAGWGFVRGEAPGLDSKAVLGCIGLGDGRVFVLGESATQTGYFSFAEDETLDFIQVGSQGPSVANAALRLLDNGHVWIGGGVSGDEVQGETWEFRPDEGTFASSASFAEARARPEVEPWLFSDTLAVGCGYSEANLEEGAASVEIVDLDGVGIQVDLDRSRPGCSMTVLPDGALLITGGYDANDAGQLGAAVVVAVL